jgi:DNA-directed RNA polymerase subunit RPC12/RpoP
MKVTRVTIISRGLSNRCPNCGGRTLFKEGRLFEVNKRCAVCDFTIERDNDEGFYLGSASLNYGMTIVLYLLPLMLLWYFDKIGGTTAAVLAGAGAIGFPILFYRSSRSWWLMNYYLVFPQHLPANGGKGRAGEDDNV